MGIIPEAVDIYALDLHVQIEVVDALHVRRVPGGWIYTEYDKDGEDTYISSVFVPFNNEFK